MMFNFKILFLFISFLFSKNVFSTDLAVTNASLGYMTNCSTSTPAVLTAASTLCGGTSGVNIDGMNGVTFFFEYEKGSGLGWECYVEVKDKEEEDDSKFKPASSQSIGGGVISLNPLKIRRSASANDNIAYTIGVNYDSIRLNCTCNTNSGTCDASDKLKVEIRKATSP